MELTLFDLNIVGAGYAAGPGESVHEFILPLPQRDPIEYFGERTMVDKLVNFPPCEARLSIRIQPPEKQFFQLTKIPTDGKVLEDRKRVETILNDYLRILSEARNPTFVDWDHAQRMGYSWSSFLNC